MDESVRDEVCSTVVLLGGPAGMRGLRERLLRELGPALATLGVREVQIIIADDHLMNQGANLLLHHPAFCRHTQEITGDKYYHSSEGGADLHEILL